MHPPAVGRLTQRKGLEDLTSRQILLGSKLAKAYAVKAGVSGDVHRQEVIVLAACSGSKGSLSLPS